VEEKRPKVSLINYKEEVRKKPIKTSFLMEKTKKIKNSWPG